MSVGASAGWPGLVVVVLGALGLSCLLLSRRQEGALGPQRWRRARRRRGNVALPRKRAGVVARLPLALRAHPLPDHRNRHGFATRHQLVAEASVAAARKRAARTRPSITLRRHRLKPSDIGYPLGRSHPSRVELWPNWECSLRLVAPPGEGKTFRALAPILRQHPGAALATSTKPDLYELTAMVRGASGPVFALDPDRLVPAAPRARWSPVNGCERSEVAERRAAALVAAIGDGTDLQNGAFFRDSARDLLKAYLHAAAIAGLDIRTVIAWSRRPEDLSPVEVLSSSPCAAPGWAELVELHTSGAAETTSGVLRYLGRSLACFSHEAVARDCSPAPGEELDIEQLLLSNGTLYLLGKGSRLGAVAPLVTALADEVFDCAERLAAQMPARRLDPPLLGLLDEAPSIAPIPALPELLADGRGRGIAIVYAMQSFSQAVSRWGPQKAETMGNATSITAVLGGLTSAGDLSDLEKLCGRRRVRRVSTNRANPAPGRLESSRTVSWEDEPVLRADQIRTLPAGLALVLWGRLPPVLSRLPLLSEDRSWPSVREEESATRLANDAARLAHDGGQQRDNYLDHAIESRQS
ncbi:MAG TPA: TraM recognition domain-containing protein [Acidimicrobiales bacterium]|nr:TraM recognition domain-containing protein [Acidimicrobiales bacterium]